MHFVVCAKQIPDPETPPSAFRVDEQNNEVVPAQGIAPVLSQFDGMAAEAALRIKEAAGDDTKITVISMGKESAQAAIKQVLAMGADEGVLLDDDAFERQAGFVTANPHLRGLFVEAGEVAARDCPVLVVGESGTGKVMFARGIHGISARRGGPFHTLYCGGSPTQVEAELPQCLLRAAGRRLGHGSGRARHRGTARLAVLDHRQGRADRRR